MEDVFPELESRPIHVAGESFGGKYVPTYVARMRRKLESIILLDALVDSHLIALGLYEHMCVPVPLTRNGRQFNSTACEVMEKSYSVCQQGAKQCDLTYDADTCAAGYLKCQAMTAQFYQGVIEGGWNPYDDRHVCHEPPLCGDQGKTVSWVHNRAMWNVC